MTLPPSSLVPPRTWRRRLKRKDINNNNDSNKNEEEEEEEEFIISTDPRLLSVQAINAAFAMDFLYWAHPLPEDVLRQALNGSLCFGVYRYIPNSNKSHNPDDDETPISPDEVDQIGLARLVTDTVTFAYLTDVYVLPAHQARGLGSWLLDCVAEALSADHMPHLRRVMLLASARESDGGVAERFYAHKLGVEVKGREVREDSGIMGGTGRVLAIMGRRGAVPAVGVGGGEGEGEEGRRSRE